MVLVRKMIFNCTYEIYSLVPSFRYLCHLTMYLHKGLQGIPLEQAEEVFLMGELTTRCKHAREKGFAGPVQERRRYEMLTITDFEDSKKLISTISKF